MFLFKGVREDIPWIEWKKCMKIPKIGKELLLSLGFSIAAQHEKKEIT